MVAPRSRLGVCWYYEAPCATDGTEETSAIARSAVLRDAEVQGVLHPGGTVELSGTQVRMVALAGATARITTSTLHRLSSTGSDVTVARSRFTTYPLPHRASGLHASGGRLVLDRVQVHGIKRPSPDAEAYAVVVRAKGQLQATCSEVKDSDGGVLLLEQATAVLGDSNLTGNVGQDRYGGAVRDIGVDQDATATTRGVWWGQPGGPTPEQAGGSGQHTDQEPAAAPVECATLGGPGAEQPQQPVQQPVQQPAPDTTAPRASLSPLPRFTLARAAGLRWSATDAGGVTRYDVRVRTAGAGSAFGTWRVPAGWQGTTATTGSLPLGAGSTACVQVRAHDRAGNVSAWSAQRCTARPLDDRSLRAGSGWSRVSDAGAYVGTRSTTVRRGAVLSRSRVQTRHVAVVATTCRGCGSVGVYLNGRLLGKVSLASSGTRRQVVLPVASLSRVQSGTLTIRSLSSRRVHVDGLGIHRG